MNLPFPILREWRQTALAWGPELRLIGDAKNYIGGEFQWIDYQPIQSAGGTMTVTPTFNQGVYCQVGGFVFFGYISSFTTGGVAANNVRVSLPIAGSPRANYFCGSAYVVDGGPRLAGIADVPIADAAYIDIYIYDGANWGLGVARGYRVSGFYEAA